MYNLREIMIRAWANFRKGGITFGEALHRSWLSAKAAPVNAAIIEEAKAEAGIDEECRTWSEWKKLGFEVIAACPECLEGTPSNHRTACACLPSRTRTYREEPEELQPM